MEFTVDRASYFNKNEKPCKEAIQKNVPGKCWVVEIKDLADLLEFVKKYDDIILYNYNHITIYDYYVE